MGNNISAGQPKNNKTIMRLIVGLIIMVAIIGGAYWYLSSQQNPAQPGQTPSGQARALDNLDQELSLIEVEGADSDFTSVDADLQSL